MRMVVMHGETRDMMLRPVCPWAWYDVVNAFLSEQMNRG